MIFFFIAFRFFQLSLIHSTSKNKVNYKLLDTYRFDKVLVIKVNLGNFCNKWSPQLQTNLIAQISRKPLNPVEIFHSVPLNSHSQPIHQQNHWPYTKTKIQSTVKGMYWVEWKPVYQKDWSVCRQPVRWTACPSFSSPYAFWLQLYDSLHTNWLLKQAPSSTN